MERCPADQDYCSKARLSDGGGGVWTPRENQAPGPMVENPEQPGQAEQADAPLHTVSVVFLNTLEDFLSWTF